MEPTNKINEKIKDITIKITKNNLERHTKRSINIKNDFSEFPMKFLKRKVLLGIK